jgi:hypothetical protein
LEQYASSPLETLVHFYQITAMTSEQQPQLPKLNIYYLDSTRVDVYLKQTENLHSILTDNSQDVCGAKSRKFKNDCISERSQSIGKRIITWVKSSTRFCLKKIQKLRLFNWIKSIGCLKMSNLGCNPQRPKLTILVDPFSKVITGFRLD